MNAIPSQISLNAKTIAQSQGVLSNSPATMMHDKSIVLCAAACFAYAGILSAKGESEAFKFKQSLIGTNGSKLLDKSFEDLGWPSAACKAMRLENDSMSIADRLPWFLSMNIG